MSLLKEMLQERAAESGPAPIDLATIKASGLRKARRRGLVIGAATSAAVMAAIMVPVTIHLDHNPTAAPVTDRDIQPGREPLSWAIETTLHTTGGQTIDVGRTIRAYVEVDHGFVFTDEHGDVWQIHGHDVSKVGSSRDDGTKQLVADGRYAAWLEGGTSPHFVTLDTQTGAVSRIQAQVDSATPSPAIYALDGTRLYGRDSHGVIAIDSATNTVTVMTTNAGDLRINDVEHGTMLVTAGRPGSERSYVTGDLNQFGHPLPIAPGGGLSQGGHYASTSAESRTGLAIVDLTTGTVIRPAQAKQFEYFTAYRWLSDNTYAAVGVNGLRSTSATKLTITPFRCVVGQECEPLDLGWPWPLELPIGENLT